MGKTFNEIPQNLIPWIQKQKMFWVATAPLSAGGHLNVSPKGYEDTFFVVDQRRVWYEDLTGSGVETISHLRENGRITIMFCAFEGPPRILRLFGTGTVHEFATAEYNVLIPPERRKSGSRAAIVVDVHRVGTSCGFGVPRYTFDSHRMLLWQLGDMWEEADQAQQDGSPIPKNGLRGYWQKENTTSIDRLPGLLTAHRTDVVPTSHGMLRSEESESMTVERREEAPDQTGSKAVPRDPPPSYQEQVGSDSCTRVDQRRREGARVALSFMMGILVMLVYTRVQAM